MKPFDLFENRLSARAQTLRTDWGEAEDCLAGYRMMRDARDEARRAVVTLFRQYALENAEVLNEVLRRHISQWPWLLEYLEGNE